MFRQGPSSETSSFTLIGFVASVNMLLPHIKPTQEDGKDHRAPGNLIVHMH
ncbi:MAG: hypothetical protein VYB59_13005 [Pseudomonadota bacterium]|nr:hypothetical protein [Pseudomonadota bacterium]